MENENRRATRASTPAKAAGHRRDVPTETESSGRTVSQPPQRSRTESCVIRSIPATLEGKPIRVVLPFPQRYSCPVQGPIRKATSFTTSIVLESQHKSPTNPIVLVSERVWVKDNVRIMENIIRISKECQSLGAKGVIFQMRPWVMLDMLAGVEQNFATELSQQLVSPESIAMRNSVTIPVCFVKQDVFEKLFLKPLLFSLSFEFTGEIQEFDRGTAVIIVPLSTQLEKCLENGGSSESAFALISSSSRTDQEKCFLVLHRCTTVVNFPLTISLALELNDGKGRPSRSYQELFAYVAHDILKTYTWSPECIALLSDPIIRRKFGDWVENVLSNRTVGGTCVSVDILIAFTHLADVSGIKRREDTWDLILPQSTLNPGFPQELFLRCLQSLREMGSPLNPSEKLKLFPLISQTGRKLKMSDIDQAFCLRDLNAVDALDAKLAHLIIAQQFDAVSSAVDLVQCYRSVTSYFAIALWKSVIKPEVSRHLIGFSPTEWIVWLRSSPFDDLNIPILDETFYRQLASNATRHPLSDYITLFSFLKEGADPRYDDSRFVSFLRSRQNKESDAWNSLNSLVLESNNPFVLSLHEVVLGTANSLELTIPSNRARWQCHIILLSSFGALDKCSALTNDLMDLAVTKLFSGCQPTDDAEELLKAFSNSFNEIEIQFVDACVQKCFLKFNIQDNCKDILALSSFVSRFASISKFEHSLFWRCIVTQQKLIKKYLKGNVVISQISDCFLNVNAVTEYDAQNLRSIDAQLEKLGRFSEISLPTMKFVRTVQSTLQNLEDAMELIQSNLPFLRSLNAFVPALIEPFRKNLWFDDHALLNTAPAPAVNQWADELKIVKRFFQTDDCRFFDHFVTNISSRISRRSVLFQDYLVHSRPEEGWRTMESFVSSLRFVEKTFARMLSIEKPPLKFDELMTLGSSLQREARTVEEEIQVLSEFYSNKHVSMNVINDLAIVLDLFHLREPMKALVEDDGLLSHCGCLGPLSEKQDPVYQQLWQLCHELDDSSIASLWTPDKCREKRDEILRLMNVPDSNSLLNIISLFEQISEASKLCEFFLHRPTYISKLDEGYSAEFRDKVEDFLSQLGGEEYKILDAFKTVSSWIVGVMVVQNSDFMSFVARLTSSPRLAPKFSQTQEEKPFLQIKSVEDNMDYINELFQKGLGSLDSVIGQLRSIDLGCAYVFDLEKGHILINLEEGGRQRTMKNDEVRDLFQRLGFIQFEEKAIAANVQNHIAKLSLFMKSLVEMTELHRLGHPHWTQTTVEVVYGMFPRTLGTQLNFDELTFLSALLAEWKAKIDEIARTTPMMSLLSLSTAQRFADMILNGDVTGALQILCYVQPGFAGSIQDLEKNIQDINNSSPSDWLDVLSKFGSKYCPKKCELTLPSRALSNLSPARYASPPSQLSLLSIMAGIFKNSRPMPAQILWCESSTTASNLESFLRRATLHPTKAFVLLSIEKLEFNQQSILLQTFSSKTNYSNVHLVESGPSIFQSSSWIPVLLFDEFVIEVNCLDILRDWSLSGNCMDHENSVLVTGPPGSGKSYQISKILRSKLENAAGPLVISVFEGFSLRSILMELFERFRTDLSSQFNCSIVIQLNLGKFKLSLKNQWTELMNRVNRFLFELLVLHCMEDPASGLLVSLPSNLQCQVLVEVPDISGHLESSAGESMMDYLPALAVISNRIDATSQSFDVSAETRHVTKYLLAFENGSIDHLYGTKSGSSGPKDVIIVLDNSGSMGGGKLETCVRCIQSDIFHSRITPNDKLGLIVFDHAINVHTPFRLFDHDHRAHVTSSLNAVRANGGTNMWTALKTAICQLQREGRDNKWIVALTDGDSDDNNVAGKVSTLLTTQASSVRMLFITVGLGAPQEALIRQNCIRNAEQGDALVRADQSAQSIADAWKEVGERLTVSQRIEKEGENISDAESNRLLRKYMKLDERNKHWSRLHQRFWINYMYRRCGILASSERFNKNNDLPGFGGFTMSVMLGEVERALDSDFSVDWSSAHHEQMVYVKSEKEGNDDYVWSVLCSDPDNTSHDWRARKQLLVKLQLTIPTKVDLNRDDRKVLDSYLATGLGIPLENSRAMRSSTGANFDFPMGSLSIIDDHKFVLTLDFVMKLLIMNERIECGIPCIMEGETGVSKTALTRMLFILKNQRNKQSSLASFIRKIYNNHLQQSYDIRLLSVLRALVDHWSLGENSAVAAALNDTPTLALALSIAKTDLWDILREEMIRDPSLDPLCERENCIRSLAQVGGGEKIVDLLLWFVGTVVSRKSNADIDWTFYPINVHAALTAQEIRECVDEAVGRLLRIDTLSNLLDAPSLRNIKMCMFFDEINTSSCMGLLKEIIVDRAMFGRPLPSNLVVIAACNPYREKFISNDRRSELGAEWVIGHYQVHPLPASLQQMSWDYGSLKPAQEKEFISKRLLYVRDQANLTKEETHLYTDLIFKAHQLTRKLAKDHLSMMDGLDKFGDVEQRAASSVSLREILRVFQIFSFLIATPKRQAVVWLGGDNSASLAHTALMLAIAVVYYLRLGAGRGHKDENFRRLFRAQFPEIENLLIGAMDRLLSEIILEPGIAKTAGLKENIFMVVLCCLSRVPLMIVGPPGSSKTLAVTIISENARGEYSKKPFFRSLPTMIPFHYQCSRQSTSTQIKEVFDRAIDRQAKADKEDQNILCFVFMDEAGLPEDERESLKVIHYYLEGHTNFGAKVGFVAISNHVLDAAKANRCAALTRAKPDHEELMNIARGCMGSDEERSHILVKISGRNRFDDVVPLKLQGQLGDRLSVLDKLCDRYEDCMNEVQGAPSEFVEFFGLRDFMHFMKLLGRNCRESTLTINTIQGALERNFNGTEGAETSEVVDFFLKSFEESCQGGLKKLTNPMLLFLDALSEQAMEAVPVSRYILIIDTTSNDTVLRVLRKQLEALFQTELMKLGWFSDDGGNQEVNFISRVRWAAERGKPAILSNSERVNESFYDLFNQHFRKYEERSAEGEIEVVYHTNIAMGSHSRRCKVTPGFQCILHITLEELQLAPAPFLNRFEKYRLTLADILYGSLEKAKTVLFLPELRDVMGPAINHLYAFVEGIGRLSFVGFEENQTIESAILLLLSNWTSHDAFCNDIELFLTNTTCRESIRTELGDDELFGELLFVENPSSCHISSCLQALAAEKRHRLHCVLISQAIVDFGLQRLLDIVLPEKLLFVSSSLPVSLISEYLNTPHHFTLDHSATREVVFMRTCESVVQLNDLDEETLIVQLSKLTRQVLNSFSSSLTKRRLIVLVDMTQTSVESINFFRSEVDDMFRGLDKTVIILIHIPYSDLAVHHCYTSTFDQDWGCRFCDSISGRETLTQLKFVFGPNSDANETGEQLLDTLLGEWIGQSVLSGAQIVIAKKRTPGSEALSLDELLVELKTIVKVSLDNESILDIINLRFKRYWQDDSGNYLLIQEQLRMGIRDATDGEILEGLYKAMTSQVRSLFDNFVQYFFLFMLRDNSPKWFLELEDVPLKRLFFDAIRTLPGPTLAELNCDHQQSGLWLRLDRSVTFTIPFFSLISQYLTAIASQTNLLYFFEEIEDVWEQILVTMTQRIKSSLDPLAQLINFHFIEGFDRTVDQTFWLQYLDCQITFELGAAMNMQKRSILTSWVLSMDALQTPYSKILAIHAGLDWNKAAFRALADALTPLDGLSPSNMMLDQLKIALVWKDDEAEAITQNVNDLMVDVCFDALRNVSSENGLKDWLVCLRNFNLVSILKQGSITPKAEEVMLVYFIATFSQKSSIPSALAFENEMRKLPLGRKSMKSLPLQELEPSVLCRIIKFFLAVGQWHDLDLKHLLDIGTASEFSVFESYRLFKVIPLKEEPHVNQQHCFSPTLAVSPLGQWIHKMESVRLIDRFLVPKPLAREFIPFWFDNSENDRFADVLFCDAFKQLARSGVSGFSFPQLASFAEELQSCVENDCSFEICRIALAATRLAMIYGIADRLMSQKHRLKIFGSETEVNRFVGQVETLRRHEGWRKESAHALASLDPAMENRVRRRLADLCDSTNVVMLSSWLNEVMCELDQNRSVGHLQVKSSQFLRFDIVQAAQNQLIGASEVVKDRILQRHVLRLLWVLPDLLEFYEWLSNKIGKTPIPVDQAKTLKIRKVMKIKESEWEEKMWIRVKLGVNSFLDYQKSTLPNLQDDLSVWNLLSTDIEDTEPSFHDLLHDIIHEMAAVFESLIERHKSVKAGAGRLERGPWKRITESNVASIQERIWANDLSVQSRDGAFENEVDYTISALEYDGELHGLLQLCFLPEKGAFDFNALGNDLLAMYEEVSCNSISLRKRIICLYEAEGPHLGSKSIACLGSFQLLHNLEFSMITRLRELLLWIEEQAQNQLTGSIRDCLCQLTSKPDESHLLSFLDDEQRSFVMSLPLMQLSSLLTHLQEMLHSASFQFAGRSLDLKLPWPSEVDVELANLMPQLKKCDIDGLESCLVKYEKHISANSGKRLEMVLVKLFSSETAMHKRYPLIRKLIDTTSAVDGFELLCGHYVQLRMQLRLWSKQLDNDEDKEKGHNRADIELVQWQRPFLFASDNQVPLVRNQEAEQVLREKFLPWFLLPSAEEIAEREAARREAEVDAFKRAVVVKMQGLCRGYLVRKRRLLTLLKEEAIKKATQEISASRSSDRGASVGATGRGRGRGRAGRGQQGRSTVENSATVSLIARLAEEESTKHKFTLKLSMLSKDTVSSWSLFLKLGEALENQIVSTLEECESLIQARCRFNELEKDISSIEVTMRSSRNERPPQPKSLRSSLKRAESFKFPMDHPEIVQTLGLLREVDTLLQTQDALIRSPCPTPEEINRLCSEMKIVHIVPDNKLLSRKVAVEAERNYFHQKLSQFLGMSKDKAVALASACMRTKDVVTEMPDDQRGNLLCDKALASLHGHTTKNLVTEAIEMLRKPPLSNWSHCELMLALANSLPFRFELFEDDCRDALKAFCDKTVSKTSIDGLAKKRVSPLLLLVASRLSEGDPQFRSSCLRRCSLPVLQAFLTDAEKAIALQPIEGGHNNASQSKPKAALDPLLERWEKLKQRNDFVPSAAMEELMALIGMKAIKEKILTLYEAILNERALPAERRVPRTYNFALLGNPGTGKTTVGKLLTRLLHDLGVRGKDDFKETTGEKLARMGADAAERLLNNSLNGTLFVDEAYALDPARNADAAAVAMQLLDAAESHRTELTIILAGYKQDMESKLFDFNDGFSRRFPYVLNFEDYNEQELGKIFESMCSTRKWRPETPAVVNIAAKRLVRGRGRKNFGNAGAVRVLFETTYERALTRDPRTEVLTITDMLGPPPDRNSVPDLGLALDELDSMIGLTSVKNQVQRLADMASKNYERELRGEAPHPVALNRVFLGNPGTGKTTVAKLYGRILKGLGLLSDGSWELKQPSDLLGAAVGETQRKTTALLDRCMGKVLIIDEAYGLHGPSYGGEALDTMVGKIHGAPGEDIAVVMIGYEKQMKKMFRETNPGLTRRFALEEAFQFADYSSAELEEVTQRYAKLKGVKLPGPVREKFIKALVAERSRPNFGNAGRVETLMSRALERMSTSRPLDNTLTLSDFGLDKADSENPFAPLQGLYKIDHIESKLRGLQATLMQCEIDGKDPSEFLPSYLFMGNPGTGKTTVARAMASILHGLGVLGSNNIVVKPAQDLQGSYVGQTKDKVNEAMAEAQGGVLFIDEAYTLGGNAQNPHSYAQEAVDQLVALMTEPEHKNKTVVILAGYTREMEAMLSSSNSGLRSRFQGRIDFPDWDASDCMSYLKQKCQQEGIVLGVAASKLLLDGLLDAYHRPGWANARDCETVYRFLYEERSLRCLNEMERNGAEFTEDDAENAMRRFLSQRPLERVVRTVNLPAVPMNMASNLPPVPPPVERNIEAEMEEVARPVDCEEAEIVNDVDGDDPVFAALLEACREAGYDSSHEKRIELIAILEGVESQSSEFPSDIIDPVCRKTRLTAPKATKILRPQVHRVLGGMRNAVEVEEARREELKRLEEEERKAKEREHEQFLERLRLCGPCPMGYSWHPCGQGMWRCAGGSHFVSTSQLPYL